MGARGHRGSLSRSKVFGHGTTLVLLACVVCVSAELFSGSVRDVNGTGIGGARVLVEETGQSAVTDGSGDFSIGGTVAVRRGGGHPAVPRRPWALDGRIYGLDGRMLGRADALGAGAVRPRLGAGVYLLRPEGAAGGRVVRFVAPMVGARRAVHGGSARGPGLRRARAGAQRRLIVSAEGYQSETYGPYAEGSSGLVLVLTRSDLPAEVSVVEKSVTRTVWACPDEGDDWCESGGGRKELTFNVVELDNGLITAAVYPEIGARILEVRDKSNGTMYFRVPNELIGLYRSSGAPLTHWKTGGIDVSFPYFEHGMHFFQPAGYRVVEEPDGGVVVAMNMRFFQYQHAKERERYGRYDDRILTVMYRLRPFTTALEGIYRLDNPNPLRRGSNLWMTLQYPVSDPSSMHAISPAVGVMGHSGNYPPPHSTSDPIDETAGFVVHCDWPFGGLYYGAGKIARLRITNPDKARAMKFVDRRDHNYYEFWSGHGTYFEDPGEFVGAYEPVHFSHYYYNTYGIGQPDYADSLFAVDVDGGRFELVAPKRGRFRVTDFGGSVLAEGVAGPYTTLSGNTADRELVFHLNGREVFRSAFPLLLEDHMDLVQTYIDRQNGADAPERSIVPYQVGHNPRLESGCGSIDNVCYRLGRFGRVSGDDDYLAALMDLENGTSPTWGTSPVEANYLRALGEIAAGNRARAQSLLDELIVARPRAYFPRLARAYLAGDLDAARRLARENPGLPEAQLVLELLGEPGAAQAKEDLLRDGGANRAGVEAFKRQLTLGAWDHVPRYSGLCDGTCP